MVQTPPHLIAGAPGLFSAELIELFEETILRSPEADERTASVFLDRFPQFLLLGTGAEVRREVVLYRPDGRALGRVDFFRREYGTRYWDIVELKDPRQPVTVAGRSRHPRLSAAVWSALSQAEDYRGWIDTDSQVRASLLRKGILVYRPRILIVVGRDSEAVDPGTLQELHDRIRRGPVELRSYSDLWRFAKEYYESYKVMILCAGSASSRQEAAADSLLISPEVSKPHNQIIVHGTDNKTLILKECRVVIGAAARIEGNIEAAIVEVYGEVRGDIRATEWIDLRRSSLVRGTVHGPRIVLEDGARFRGTIDMSGAIDTKPPNSALAPDGWRRR
jgi:Polymer-forming cytoskeletal/Domain of unknown function (DUF4263)